MMITRLDALIFDVDGTLAETEEIHRAAFNQAFAEASLDWIWDRDLYRDLLRITGGKERIAHVMGTDAGDRRVRDLHARKTEIYTDLVAGGAMMLRPGVEALIGEARRRDVFLGIATTTSRPNVDALLAATLGPEAIFWFSAIACGDQVTLKKPAPEIYHLALSMLGVPAGRAVAVEDSWNGVRAARTAGLAVIATPSLYSAGEDFSEANAVGAPEDVIQILGWARGAA